MPATTTGLYRPPYHLETPRPAFERVLERALDLGVVVLMPASESC